MYTEEFIECMTECEEVINEEAIKMQSIHPYEIIADPDNVLHEAFISKENVKNAIAFLIRKLREISKKAMKVAITLSAKNKAWCDSVTKFLASHIEVKFDDYEMYDYPTGIQRMTSIAIPRFESIDIGHFENDGEVFKQKAFGDIFNTEIKQTSSTTEDKENTGTSALAKAYFRGGAEKKKFVKGELKSLMQTAIKYILTYKNFINNIYRDSEQIISAYNSITKDLGNKPITESTLLHESAFKEEYLDILLEDAVEPDDVEKSMENGNNDSTPINSNSEENKVSDDIRGKEKALNIWFKTCSTIFTAKYDIAQEAYKAYSDFLDRCMDNSTKKD